eukprot:TRINITY_DN8409_c0_g1_i1.p1 TRINITY_DN8409_c0_g1~~TRINITY_DN8409_c0_g1_i1.p1  ORF type:complete len:176 (+),score=37.27 TRINITY_DN8409_c0_g1_i1:619-1146(+)
MRPLLEFVKWWKVARDWEYLFLLLFRTHTVWCTELLRANLLRRAHPKNFNIGLVNYSPLAGGMLTGKYLASNSDKLDKNSRFKQFPSYQIRFQQQRVVEAVEKYNSLAQKKNIPLAHMSLSFCRSQEFITSTIIGGTSVSQLQENIKSLGLSLDEDTLKDIDQIYLQHRDPQNID